VWILQFILSIILAGEFVCQIFEPFSTFGKTLWLEDQPIAPSVASQDNAAQKYADSHAPTGIRSSIVFFSQTDRSRNNFKNENCNP
jgi:hypothetical protein